MPRRDQIQDFYLQILYGGTKYFQSRTPSISREASEDLQPSVVVLTPQQDRHPVMNFPREVIGGSHDQGCAQNRLARFKVFPLIP